MFICKSRILLALFKVLADPTFIVDPLCFNFLYSFIFERFFSFFIGTGALTAIALFSTLKPDSLKLLLFKSLSFLLALGFFLKKLKIPFTEFISLFDDKV